MVHVSDPERESFFSLLVHPLNGRVQVQAGYVAPAWTSSTTTRATGSSEPR